MNKFSRYGFIAIAWVFVFSAFAAVATNAQTNNEILTLMDKHYNALTSLRTNVTYVKYDSVLKDSDTMEGKAIYAKAKNQLFRIDWKSPVESLAVNGKDYAIYRPKLNQMIVGNTKKAKKDASGVSSPLAFIYMSKAQLKANYTIIYLGEEKVNGTTRTFHLELTPKTAQTYKVADIWVDGNGMPIQMRTTEKNGNSTSVLLTSLEKNVTLNGLDFKIDTPKGTKIIKN